MRPRMTNHGPRLTQTQLAHASSIFLSRRVGQTVDGEGSRHYYDHMVIFRGRK
jgi:hypothetical protein